MRRGTLPRHLKKRRKALVADGILLDRDAFETLRREIAQTPGLEWYSAKVHSNWLGTQRRKAQQQKGGGGSGKGTTRQRETRPKMHETRHQGQDDPYPPPHAERDALERVLPLQNADIDPGVLSADATKFEQLASGPSLAAASSLDVFAGWYVRDGTGGSASREAPLSDGSATGGPLSPSDLAVEFFTKVDDPAFYPNVDWASYTTAAGPSGSAAFWHVE
ncbi:hypothetical protein FKP32DRAFT_555860 [Trametes sanguinea]|nr:hypothetical protein FKP32DRAFT_555860 [Trametes sanguinea]